MGVEKYTEIKLVLYTIFATYFLFKFVQNNYFAPLVNYVLFTSLVLQIIRYWYVPYSAFPKLLIRSSGSNFSLFMLIAIGPRNSSVPK